MTSRVSIKGGCLCGSNRFEINAELYVTGYCHCSMCRRTSGAPLTAWLSVRKSQFSWGKSDVREFRSSIHVSRFSCGNCGAQLVFEDDRYPDLVSVQIGTFDHPDKYGPQFHIYYEDRVKWLMIDDDLPKFSAEYTGDDPFS